jgi:ABC-type uncharacterized transport system permease subunit
VVWWLLFRTRFGLRLRAVGENPHMVDAAGVSVQRLRYAALTMNGVLCGLAGSYLVLAQNASFSQNMTAGRGFMALAALIFGRWHPLGALWACLLFGFLGGLSETTANIAAPPLIIYYLGIGLPPLMLVPAMNISFFVGKSTQLATLMASGIATPMHWLVTLPLAVIATIASLYGSRVRSRIDGETYRVWMKRLLLTMAMILLAQVAWRQLLA